MSGLLALLDDVAGIAKVAAYKNDLQYAATGDLQYAHKARDWQNIYTERSASGSDLARQTGADYMAQAQRVREAEYAVTTRQAQRRAREKGEGLANTVTQAVDGALHQVEQGLQDGLKRRNAQQAALAPPG